MKVTRVALYIRVSHQEQKLHGLSLDAQKKTLTEYAKKHKYKVIDIYTDEGISARKVIKKRPALQRMLNDAKEGMFDLILFIKLDRYFRSVAEYHECQKILDEHDIKWNATEEKYDITTANGRAFVNMKLTINELEADQGGERVDLVNKYKVSVGQAITGSVPFGFSLEKREDNRSYYIHNPEQEPIVYDMINHYLKYHSLRELTFYINDKYDLDLFQDSVKKLLRNPLLYGFYRGNPNYCPPYCTKETFDKIQEIREGNIKMRTGSKNFYIFTGLIVCSCGWKKSGNTAVQRYKDSVYRRPLYRCNNKYNQHKCNAKSISEKKLEEYLLANITDVFNKYVAEIELEDKKEKEKTSKSDVNKIKNEMERLNLMYQKNRITLEKYDIEYDILEKKLAKCERTVTENKKRDLEPMKELLNSNFESIYLTLTPENKRAFWRSIIKEIRQVNDDKFEIIFL